MYQQINLIGEEVGEVVVSSTKARCTLSIRINQNSYEICAVEEPNHGRKILQTIPFETRFLTGSGT